jgi:ADP-heptose:LPS heptosyltransferase
VGAGDEFIASGEARRLHQKLSKPVVIVDRYGQPRAHPLWAGVPYIVSQHSRNAVIIRNCPGFRPYIEGKAKERWVWRKFVPTPAELVFTPEELAWAKRGRDAIVLEPSLKTNASPNKRWGKWTQLVEALRGHRLVQFPGDKILPGVEVIETPSIRHAAAVMSGAQGAVLHEGGLHHAAAAVGLRAVVLFGGYISPQQTGYKLHANLFTGGYACGMRRSCAHCLAAMDKITVNDVVRALDDRPPSP